MVASDLLAWKTLNKHDSELSPPLTEENLSTAQQSPIVFSSDIQNKLVCLPEGIHPKINQHSPASARQILTQDTRV